MSKWLLTEIKVVVVEQELRQVEEFWNEFFDVGHVVLGSGQPRVLDAVEHAVGQVKVSTLTSTQRHRHSDANNVSTTACGQ